MDTSERDDLAGDLATVTDEEWRTAHERLARDLFAGFDQPGSDEADEVGRQLAYVWAPGSPPPVVDGERDEAPAPGEWIGRAPDGEHR